MSYFRLRFRENRGARFNSFKQGNELESGDETHRHILQHVTGSKKGRKVILPKGSIPF